MRNVVILEAAQYVDDGVRLADIGEELVAKAFALAGALDEAGDVHEVHAGRNDLFRAGHLRQPVQARLRHGDFAHVRLDGAEGIVGGLGGGRLRQSIEKGGLADVWQANDTAFEAHGANTSKIPERAP